MKVEVYVLANNEEKLMPYIMRHYSQFANVIILESNSTDRTVEIAHSLGAEIRIYDIPDEMDDLQFSNIKGNCWKESKADWVVVTDADEFVYHPNILEILEKTKETVIRTEFYGMFSETFPTGPGQIYEYVTMGKDENYYRKMNIFRPSEIMEINYEVGCHVATPVDKNNIAVIWNNVSGIKTLHMKFLSRQYTIDRLARESKRLSIVNRQNNWGLHVDQTPEQINKYFDDVIPNLIKIL